MQMKGAWEIAIRGETRRIIREKKNVQGFISMRQVESLDEWL